VSLSGFSLFPHKLAFPEAVKLSTETEGSLIRITNTSKVPLDFFISDYIGSDVQISISWDNSLTNVPPGASRTIRATAVVHAPLQLNLSLLLMVLGTSHAHIHSHSSKSKILTFDGNRQARQDQRGAPQRVPQGRAECLAQGYGRCRPLVTTVITTTTTTTPTTTTSCCCCSSRCYSIVQYRLDCMEFGVACGSVAVDRL